MGLYYGYLIWRFRQWNIATSACDTSTIVTATTDAAAATRSATLAAAAASVVAVTIVLVSQAEVAIFHCLNRQIRYP